MSIKTRYRTCNLCEAICGLEVKVENNTVLSIRGDEQDVFSKGHICPKAVGMKDLHEDPDRLKTPLVKRDGKWIDVSWQEAYALAAKGIIDTQIKYGKDAVGIYQGNPSVHNLGTSLFSPDFVRSLKTKNRYSATSVDQLAHHLAAEYMFGNQLFIPVPDINRTDFWLILGGNPMVSNGSMMTAPDIRGKLRDIQDRSGQVVVIDPRFTETAEKADQHLFIRPGSDIYLLLSMIHIILFNDKMELKHLENCIDADEITAIKAAVAHFTPELAEEKTGIPAVDIQGLTDSFLSAKSAVCYGRLGVSASKYGGLSHWAINTINILSGNFDKAGGAMFTNPAVNVSSRKSKTKRFKRWSSRVRGLPEYGGELPSSTLAEDILTPGEGQIKAMITSCGNPVLSVPNGTKMDSAFESLDFMVCIDIYLNETTKHADVILPPATGLETPHYAIAFHNLAVHNSAKFSEAAVEKSEGAKFDWEIFSELGKACAAYQFQQTGEAIPDKPEYTLEQKLDMLLSFGPHKLNLETLKKHPHGIDIGPLTSQLPGRLLTDNQQIHVFPDIYQESIETLRKSSQDDDGFLLIGRRNLRSNNSWMHNLHRMVKGPNTCTALIHPTDASRLQISTGEIIEVSSDVGQVQIEAEVSEEIMPGTISIPHGWGHNRSGIRMSIAQEHAGVSFNDLADEKLVDELSGVSVINAIPIQVKKLNS